MRRATAKMLQRSEWAGIRGILGLSVSQSLSKSRSGSSGGVSLSKSGGDGNALRDSIGGDVGSSSGALDRQVISSLESNEKLPNKETATAAAIAAATSAPVFVPSVIALAESIKKSIDLSVSLKPWKSSTRVGMEPDETKDVEEG